MYESQLRKFCNYLHQLFRKSTVAANVQIVTYSTVVWYCHYQDDGKTQFYLRPHVNVWG